MSAPYHSARSPPPPQAGCSIVFPTELYKDQSAPCSGHVHGMEGAVTKKEKPRLKLSNPATNLTHSIQKSVVVYAI